MPNHFRLPFHYAWVIALAGMLTLFTSLGLGRFALGMLLPSMGATLALSYAQMGFISTANFLGYLAAVVLCRYGVARYGSRLVIAAALLTLGLSMALIGQAQYFLPVLLLYGATGIASGFSNVPMMGLVTPWFSSNQRGKAAGFMSSGNGFGIMFSGLLVPVMNAQYGAEGWRTSWLIFGVVAAVIAAVCLALLRNHPRDVGLHPLSGNPAASQTSPPADAVRPSRWLMLQLGGSYFCFGFTYAIYVTFIVTTLVQERGFSEAEAGQVWFWIGLLSLFSGPVFGTLSDRLGRKAGLMLVFALQGTAYALVAEPLSHALLYLSVGLFGICAWSIPSIMAATVGDYLGPQRAVAAFGTVTFFFAIGQITGPGLAGLLAEHSGYFASSYWLAAALAGSAVLIAASLRKPAGND